MKLLNEGLVMTQEDKELLLKDLCARLPYGVKCIVTESRTEQGQKGDIGKIGWVCLEGVDCIDNRGSFFSEFGNFKPYLFPLSSMTEDQYIEFIIISGWNCDITDIRRGKFPYISYIGLDYIYNTIDWFNKNHFDYRGLIKKGLAIDATGLNIY